MNVFSNLIITSIIALWLIVLPIFAIQNVYLVSLKFFFIESISIPVGILLSFCVAIGFILGSFLPLFFNKSPQKRGKKSRKKQVSQSFARDWEKEEEKDPIFDWE